ncbi:MAG: carboxymuconolactone decarboxylase family protein [Bacteroidales bacterium]|nr:carboxymuconolactone decarboxylase family protein [Bacteroidales bacterium]
MNKEVKKYNEYREKMNNEILSANNKIIKRLFNIDTNAYKEGALSAKTKEMLGLVASMVLKCDDCIKYHLIKCKENNITNDEIFEIFAIANLVGGSIVIPHTRKAVEFWNLLKD